MKKMKTAFYRKKKRRFNSENDNFSLLIQKKGRTFLLLFLSKMLTEIPILKEKAH